MTAVVAIAGVAKLVLTLALQANKQAHADPSYTRAKKVARAVKRYTIVRDRIRRKTSKNKQHRIKLKAERAYWRRLLTELGEPLPE